MTPCSESWKACRSPIPLLLVCLLFMTGCSRAAQETAGQTAAIARSAGESTSAADAVSTLSDAVVQVPDASTEGSAAVTETAVSAAQSGVTIPPSRESLSVFPGVLRTMNMTREAVLLLLGEGFETYDNVSQAFSVYTWAEFDLTLEYDSLSGLLRTILMGERSVFLDGADYQRADLNGDGVMEGICAFEDMRDITSMAGAGVDPVNRREGHVVLLDEASGKQISECFTRPFGGYASLSFLTAYGAGRESLVIIDTQAYWESDVLSFTGGQLVSMLPSNTLQLTDQATLTRNPAMPDRVALAVTAAGLFFDCLMPERLQEALLAGQAFKYRFLVNRKPVVTDDGLSLQLRNSLQVMLGEAVDLEGAPIGRYIDIGQVSQEYRYIGQGVWKLLKTAGGPKYTDIGQGGNITPEDLTVGQAVLFSALYDFTEMFGLDPELYADVDLVGGITFMSEGMRIHVVNARIANISMEKGCKLDTVRGLAVGASRGDALVKYGQPDFGYFEDRVWTYWFYRDFDGAEERTLSLDSFSIEFSGDKVERIRMDAYIPID